MNEFLSMGGYAFYVWGSYLVAAVLIGVEIATVRARLKAAHAAAGESEAGA